MPPDLSLTATTDQPQVLHQLRRDRAHVAEALDGHPGARDRHAQPLQRLAGDQHAPPAGRLAPAERAAHLDRLAGHDRGDGVALVHGVGVHDPRHHPLVGVDVGRGDVGVGAQGLDDRGGVAPGDALQLRVGELERIADHAALRAAERDVDHRALPGHPRRQRLHLVERDRQCRIGCHPWPGPREVL